MAQTATERLLALKEEIMQAKLDRATVEGSLNQNLERLKSEFGCRSLEQGKVKLEQLKKQKETLQLQIEKAVAKLESSYSW
jgi:type II secretory pathway component PulM